MATSEFGEWLDNFDSDDIEELIALYHTVENKCSEGGFKIQETENGGWIVSFPGNSEELFIANEEARKAFLAIFRDKYGDVEFKDAIHRNND